MPKHIRHHPRVAQKAGVELRSGDVTARCQAQDVSLAGCYLETAQGIAGEIVDLVFLGSDDGEIAHCKAKVLRRELRPNGRQGLAVRFLQVGWGDLFGLARLVAPGLA